MTCSPRGETHCGQNKLNKTPFFCCFHFQIHQRNGNNKRFQVVTWTKKYESLEIVIVKTSFVNQKPEECGEVAHIFLYYWWFTETDPPFSGPYKRKIINQGLLGCPSIRLTKNSQKIIKTAMFEFKFGTYENQVYKDMLRK